MLRTVKIELGRTGGQAQMVAGSLIRVDGVPLALTPTAKPEK